MLRAFGRVKMRSVTTIGRSATHPSAQVNVRR
jgi:hypothetical protein